MLNCAARTAAWEMMMRTSLLQWLVLALALVASACSTPERRAERARAAMEQRMALHGPACARLGNAPDTDPWRHCVVERSSRAELDEQTGYHMGWRHGIW
jgi:hypothetical protein